uniref:RING-type E3 ubiquitin transferase n=1 Tax=Heligmosomoides polygyrus TaxID=6339 RepID=A0A183GLQ7_HELPZ
LASEVGCNREHESNQEGDSESKDNEDDYVIDGTVKYKTDTSIWRELPESAWGYVPFKTISIESVEVSQVGWYPLREEIYTLLTNVSATTLLMNFYSRNVARRLLQTISFGLRSALILVELSKGIDKKPILHPSQLMKFDVVAYMGEMSMFSNDLLAALDSHYTLLTVSKE